MRAVVVGAGIGGLSAAIALRQAGIEPVVVERADELESVGYGITLAANAMAALERLELADAVRMSGYRAPRVQIKNWRGTVLVDMSWVERGWEMVGIHRAELQRILLEAAGRDAVRLGRACTGFREELRSIVATNADGSEEVGDLLVGADGIHSLTRATLFGRGEPRYSGHVGWRAVAEFEHSSIEGVMTESWGPEVRFGIVPIGRRRVYWFVAEAAEEDAPLRPHPKERFLRRFADWHEPISDLIEATDESVISRTFVYDRKPLRQWGRGRVTLLGDAAHPMTPNLGQGAAQALEDAVVLGRSLGENGDAVAALRRYESRRRRRAAAIVKQSRKAGRLAQLRSPLACRIRDRLVSALPDRLSYAQQARVLRARLD